MIRAVFLIALAGAPAVASAQGLRDFARGIEIRTDGPGSIFRVVLPDDVCATVTRPDLSDPRVLDAAGDRVPHTLREALRPLPGAPMAEIRWTTIPGQRSSDESGAAVYDIRARFPVEQVDLEFVDPTDAATVTVQSRPDPWSDWRVRHSGVFYSVAGPGTRLGSSPAVMKIHRGGEL